jgi:hypothetical protein
VNVPNQVAVLDRLGARTTKLSSFEFRLATVPPPSEPPRS